MSQARQIRAYLLKGKVITPIKALNLFGCFRLGARIYDLRKEGLPIQTRIDSSGGKNFAEYFIPKT